MGIRHVAAFLLGGLVLQGHVAAQAIDMRDFPTPHGHGSTASFMLGQDSFLGFTSQGWQRLAARENLLVIAPQGVKAKDGKYAWNDCRGDATTNAETDDVAFVSALIDRAVKVYRADPRRVYVFGSSNGGGMAYRLGTELGPKLAGIAVQSSLMAAHSACKPAQHPLAVFVTHGTEDRIAPFGGGEVSAFGLRGRGTGVSAEESVAVWRRLAGLPDKPVVYRFPQTSSATSATRFVWGDDPRGLQVEFLRIDGGGHTWASKHEEMPWLLRKLLGEVNRDVDTEEEVWNFFRDKRAPAN